MLSRQAQLIKQHADGRRQNRPNNFKEVLNNEIYKVQQSEQKKKNKKTEQIQRGALQSIMPACNRRYIKGSIFNSGIQHFKTLKEVKTTMRNPKNMTPHIKCIKFDSIKFLVLISKVIAIIGFFLIGGAMGGCDNGALSIGKAIMYIVIGIVISIAGVLAVKYFDEFEDDNNDE